MKKLERIHFLSQPSMLKSMRDFVRELSIKQGCSHEAADCLIMATNEACMNVMQHAYDGREDEEIIIEFWKDKEELVIRIFDSAEAVNIDLIKSRDLDDVRPGGLGVHFIKQVMDVVLYENNSSGDGNMLEMRKNLNNSFECQVKN